MLPVGRAMIGWAVIAGIGWTGLVLIAVQLAQSPPGVGFDLRLLIEAGRAISAGQTPYDMDIIDGRAPSSTSLFYSYPPPVAQAMALLASLPDTLILGVWWTVAVGGTLLVAEALRRRLAPHRSALEVSLGVLGATALILPFGVGLLFGNLDVWFPLLYGSMLCAILASDGRAGVLGGTALVIASLKLHPGALAIWFFVRGVTAGDRSRRQAQNVLMTACLHGLLLICVSLFAGGLDLWKDYAAVVQTGTNADLLDPRNAAPSVLIATALGRDTAFARSLHLVVAVLVLVISGAMAWRRKDPVESLAWAAAVSLATLPVTWYHYPSAMIPFGIAAALRAPSAARRTTTSLLVAAALAAVAALSFLPLLWIAVGLVIAAARASRPAALGSEAG
jgi:hypothetical protein